MSKDKNSSVLVDSAPGHQQTEKPPSGGFILSVNPTNFHTQPFDPLPIPPDIHHIAPDSKVLGADRTPDLARLMLLFKLLFQLIFPAAKA